MNLAHLHINRIQNGMNVQTSTPDHTVGTIISKQVDSRFWTVTVDFGIRGVRTYLRPYLETV